MVFLCMEFIDLGYGWEQLWKVGWAAGVAGLGGLGDPYGQPGTAEDGPRHPQKPACHPRITYVQIH